MAAIAAVTADTARAGALRGADAIAADPAGATCRIVAARAAVAAGTAVAVAVDDWLLLAGGGGSQFAGPPAPPAPPLP